jgi:glutaminyl-peptide cyclotransferase
MLTRVLVPSIILCFIGWTAAAFHFACDTDRRMTRHTSTPVSGYEIINRYPHDPTAFTQGLAFRDGFLYESTGLNGQSSIRKVDLRTGTVERSLGLATDYFGEGLTIIKKRIFQLTWLSNTGFVYRLKNFRLLETFSYGWEGWGLTHDDRSLIMSDGSSTLRFIDPDSFQLQKALNVTFDGQPLRNLNELEFVEGEIYSNVWHTNSIARIDPESGRVVGMIDLTGLDSGLSLGSEDVLNGIAYDQSFGRLFVTGKRWPVLFEIRIKAS